MDYKWTEFKEGLNFGDAVQNICACLDRYVDRFKAEWLREVRSGSDLTAEIMDNLPNETPGSTLSSSLNSVFSKYGLNITSDPQRLQDNLFTEYLKKSFCGCKASASKLIDLIYLDKSPMTKEKFARINKLIYQAIKEVIQSQKILAPYDRGSDSYILSDKEILPDQREDFAWQYVTDLHISLYDGMPSPIIVLLDYTENKLGTHLAQRDIRELVKHRHTAFGLGYDENNKLTAKVVEVIDPTRWLGVDKITKELNGNDNTRAIRDLAAIAALPNTDISAIRKGFENEAEVVMHKINSVLPELLNFMLREDHALEDLVSWCVFMWNTPWCSRLSEYEEEARKLPEGCKSVRFGGAFTLPRDHEDLFSGDNLVKSVMALILAPVSSTKIGDAEIAINGRIDSNLSGAASIAGYNADRVRVAATVFGEMFANLVLDSGNLGMTRGVNLGRRMFFDDKIEMLGKKYVGLREQYYRDLKENVSLKLLERAEKMRENDEAATLGFPKIRQYMGLINTPLIHACQFVEDYAFPVSNLLGACAMNIMGALSAKAASEAFSYDLKGREYFVGYGMSSDLVHVVVKQYRREKEFASPMKVALPIAKYLAREWATPGGDTGLLGVPVKAAYAYKEKVRETGEADLAVNSAARGELPEGKHLTDALPFITNIFWMVGNIRKGNEALVKVYTDAMTGGDWTEEDRSKVENLVKEHVPDFGSKEILIFDDSIDLRSFSNSFTGCLTPEDRGQYEAEFRKVRQAMEDGGVYIISGRRPLTREEVRSDDEVCFLTSYQADEDVIDQELKRRVGIRERKHVLGLIDGNLQNSRYTSWSRKWARWPLLNTTVSFQRYWNEQYDPVFSASDSLTAHQMQCVSKFMESYLTVQYNDFRGGGDVTAISNPDMYGSSREFLSRRGRMPIVMVGDQDEHTRSTSIQSDFRGSIKITGDDHQTVRTNRVVTLRNAGGGAPNIQSLVRMSQVWEEEKRPSYKLTGFTFRTDSILPYAMGNRFSYYDFDNRGSRIEYTRAERAIAVINKERRGLTEQDNADSETGWIDWVARARERYDEHHPVTDNTGNSDDAILSSAPGMMLIVDTMNIHKELNIYVSLAQASNRRAMLTLLNMCIARLEDPTPKIKAAHQDLAGDAVKDEKQRKEGDFIEGEISSVMLQSKIDNNKKSIDHMLRDLRRVRDQYVKAYHDNICRIRECREQLTSIKRLNGVDPDEIKLQKLIQNGIIKGVRTIIEENGDLRVYVKMPTTYIWCGAYIYDLGEITTVITNFGGIKPKVNFYADKHLELRWTEAGFCDEWRNQARSFVYSRADAVHVRQGTGCLGNIENALSDASARSSLSSYITWCKRYLGSINLHDTYGKCITLWPRVPATLHNVVKYGVLASGRITDRICLWTGDNSRPENNIAGIADIHPDLIKALWVNAKEKLDANRFSGSDVSVAEMTAAYDNRLLMVIDHITTSDDSVVHYESQDVTLKMENGVPCRASKGAAEACYRMMDRVIASLDKNPKAFSQLWGNNVEAELDEMISTDTLKAPRVLPADPQGANRSVLNLY